MRKSNKIEQLSFYLQKEAVNEIKEYYSKLNASGRFVSVSSIIREVVLDWLEEERKHSQGSCGCSVCEDRKQPKTAVSSEVAAAFGYNKKYKAPPRPKVVKNKPTQPTTGTTQTIHSIKPPKTPKPKPST